MRPQELKDWRKALELTQEEAAEILEMSTRGYAKMETGVSPIKNRTALAAEAYLRRYRTKMGNNGKPLLYTIRFYPEIGRAPSEIYLVVARDDVEAARLAHNDAGRNAPPTVAAEAVCDAPEGAEPRVLGTLAQMLKRKRIRFI